MYSKTTTFLSMTAISGVMANYPASSAAYSSSVAYPSSSYPANTYPAVSYPVNNTAPTSVWQYYNTTVPTTVVVPQLTTVCGQATTMTYNGVQYTATAGQTVTVTNCPCTVTTVSSRESLYQIPYIQANSLTLISPWQR